MNGNENSSNSGKPKRGPMIAFLAMVFLMLAGMVGASIWLFMHFMNQPQPAMNETATPATQQPVMPGLHGHVLLADGTPVSKATVFVALPGPSNLRIRNGKIFFENDGPGNFTRVSTRADGQYDLPQQSGNFVVEAITDAGYAQLDQDAVAKKPDIQLTKWGRIQGRLMIGTKPGADVKLQAYAMDLSRSRAPVNISMANFAETDSNGNFTMECVVPGAIQIVRNIGQQSGGKTFGFSGDVGTAQVVDGQTTTVILGGVGRPVVGKFVFPPTMDPSDYFINARAIPLVDNAALPSQHLLQVDEQHHFRIDDVPAGDYRIHVFLQKAGGDRTAQPEQARFTMPDVPGGVSDEPLVIPDIQLQ